ncbi:hypothetical protein Taro_053458, partial [Colocasia esculenta]|nr:hypothetical protein [Colocasia esculenta]
MTSMQRRDSRSTWASCCRTRAITLTVLGSSTRIWGLAQTGWRRHARRTAHTKARRDGAAGICAWERMAARVGGDVARTN